MDTAAPSLHELIVSALQDHMRHELVANAWLRAADACTGDGTCMNDHDPAECDGEDDTCECNCTSAEASRSTAQTHALLANAAAMNANTLALLLANPNQS